MRTKRFLGVVLSAVMCLSLPASFTAFAAEDTCTSHSYINGFCTVCDSYQSAVQNENGYYEIGNAGQLYWFADKVNNDYDNYNRANAILTDNITVNKNVLVSGELNTNEEVVAAFRAWTPIGNDGSIYYNGTFEGNGKTVSGLYFNESNTSYVGLFGCTGSATIQNVSVADSYFHGNIYVGGVAGSGDGTITNCRNAAYVSGYGYVGGINGHCHDVTIENCYNTGTVKAEAIVGGVMGQHNGGTVKNCYNIGSVTGNIGLFGGVLGSLVSGTVTNCYYLDSSCTSVGDGGTAKTAEQFKSGEVAYLLQGQQETDVWGQIIGIDSYPVLGGMKVIFENDTYKNQVTEFEIISLGENKKSANVAFLTKGTYTLILADYEESRLNNIDTITVETESDNTIKTVTSEKDITLGIGDKVMLWKDMENLVPMCEAYIVE